MINMQNSNAYQLRNNLRAVVLVLLSIEKKLEHLLFLVERELDCAKLRVPHFEKLPLFIIARDDENVIVVLRLSGTNFDQVFQSLEYLSVSKFMCERFRFAHNRSGCPATSLKSMCACQAEAVDRFRPGFSFHLDDITRTAIHHTENTLKPDAIDNAA